MQCEKSAHSAVGEEVGGLACGEAPMKHASGEARIPSCPYELAPGGDASRAGCGIPTRRLGYRHSRLGYRRSRLGSRLDSFGTTRHHLAPPGTTALTALSTYNGTTLGATPYPQLTYTTLVPPLLHTPHSHHSFTPLIHTTHSHHSFTPLIHTTHAHHAFTPRIHTLDEHPASRREDEGVGTPRAHLHGRGTGGVGSS